MGGGQGALGGSTVSHCCAPGRFLEPPGVMKREEEAETLCAGDHLSTGEFYR